MTSKVFKTVDEQIEILKSKGLVINNCDYAKEVLLRENYFFLSGYRDIFMRNIKDSRFIEGTTFEELYSMFRFDRRIRNIYFKYLLVIENNIKSIISYQMSKKYGYKEKDYLSPRNYVQDGLKVKEVNDVLNKMKRQIRNNGSKHTATMHYINNYGYIPMWVLVKVLSIGIISELFDILKPDDQISICEMFKVTKYDMKVYLLIISNFRNICAHEDIFYLHRTQMNIPNTFLHGKLELEMAEEEYLKGKNDVFALTIILKRLLKKEDFSDLINEISYEVDILDGCIETVPISYVLDKMGFPANFREIKDI